jgi:4-aminobutyrate aminotransferase
VACAAGLATLETIAAENLTDNAAKVGEELLSGLGEMPTRCPRTVTEVRGVGLMISVEFPTGEEAEAVPLRAFAHGLLVLECGESTVRMSPPLVVTLEQAHTALRIFGDSVAAVAE